MSKAVAPDTVKRLVETFDDHADWYKSSDYKEARLREEFLNPLFTSTDIANRLRLSASRRARCPGGPSLGFG